MHRLIALEAGLYAGRTSLRMAEYEAWTLANLEGVVMAKHVDR